MAVKDNALYFMLTKAEKEAIANAARELDIPVSQFMREAAREKIAAMKQAQQAEAAATR